MTTTTLQIEENARERLRDSFDVLNYNQQLVQFADSKAGTLILINSLFVAATQALKPATELASTLQSAGMVAATLAVAACLLVVMTKTDFEKRGRADKIFFADILRSKSPGRYAQEFVETASSTHLEDVLRRAYVVSDIATRKFQSYGMAQNLTALSAMLWLAGNLAGLG